MKFMMFQANRIVECVSLALVTFRLCTHIRARFPPNHHQFARGARDINVCSKAGKKLREANDTQNKWEPISTPTSGAQKISSLRKLELIWPAGWGFCSEVFFPHHTHSETLVNHHQKSTLESEVEEMIIQVCGIWFSLCLSCYFDNTMTMMSWRRQREWRREHSIPLRAARERRTLAFW